MIAPESTPAMSPMVPATLVKLSVSCPPTYPLLMVTVAVLSVAWSASATVMSGSPDWLHYVSSKGAVIAMTRALARELGNDRVTVNALAPGFTLTEASLGLMEDAASYGITRGAIKRAAGSDDMVGAALFLGEQQTNISSIGIGVTDIGRSQRVEQTIKQSLRE